MSEGQRITQLEELAEPMASEDLLLCVDMSIPKTKRVKQQYVRSTYVTRVTGDYTVSHDNEVIFATGTLTITLALASKEWTVKIANSGTGVITYTRAGADTIEGATSGKLTGQYQTIKLTGDGVSTHIEF